VVYGAYPRKNGDMTLVPIDYSLFCKNRGGELFYGATGFMMMTYNIVDKIAKHLKEPVLCSKESICYPFFFERMIKEEQTKELLLWLGEDYSFCWLARQM